ncbi:MAG: hypothetical protein WCE61_03580 [Candidatus Acidiferrum sp.]
MRFLLLFLSIILPTIAQGRIGETALQFVDRYGPPKDSQSTKLRDKASTLIEGAIHHTYEYQGWKIRAAFLELNGPCVRMDYQKIFKAGVKLQIQDYELEAIMSANTPAGMSWQQVMYSNPDLPGDALHKLAQGYVAGAMGEKMWQRTDGVILWLRSHLIVRLELPIARQCEAQLKAAKSKERGLLSRNSSTSSQCR